MNLVKGRVEIREAETLTGMYAPLKLFSAFDHGGGCWGVGKVQIGDTPRVCAHLWPKQE
jgi:hypothetical protein